MKQTTSLLFHFPSFRLARYALPCHSFVWPLGSSIMCGGPAPVEVGLLWQVVVRIVVVEVLYVVGGRYNKKV